MFKKLTDLLFEEADDDIEEEVQEKVAPVKQASTPSSKPSVQVPETPALKRIDVTQNIPVQKTQAVVEEKPVENVVRPSVQPVQHASPKAVPPQPPVTPKVRNIGITVDGVDEVKVAKTSERVTPSLPKKQRPQSTRYEFQPVISPYFGVSDKDLDAMKTTAKPVKKSASENNNVHRVISPIYGSFIEDEPTNIQDKVEKSNYMEEMTYTKEKKKAEEKLESFSLDDIIKARDEEFSKEAKRVNLFQQEELFDETTVYDKRDFVRDTKGKK